MNKMPKNIIKFGAYDTRRNLPSKTGRRRGETLFLSAFIRAFTSDSGAKYIVGRQFAMPDCGVADCIAVRNWDIPYGSRKKPHVIAFETKLSDWKKAMAQAYRYRYYADESVVVVPPQVARIALKNRHLFEEVGVGLWTFDPDSYAIQHRVSPKKTSPLSNRKRKQALSRIERRSTNLRKISK